jgi:alkylhydroperoxidase family enzyme
MIELDYSGAGIPIREDLRRAHGAVWDHLRRPGTWWSGAERIAIAREVRHAGTCGLCRERKVSLSPEGVPGRHDGHAELPENVVEVIHRVRTDPARLSRAWFAERLSAGLEEAAYVEVVGVVTLTTGIDFACRALGIAPFPFPEPLAGEPSRHRPTGAKSGIGWVAMIAPADASGPEADLYPEAPMIPNIMRALSLVPEEARALRRSSDAHYLPVAQISDPTARRALDRMQMELVAARVSALNQCFY